MLMLKIATFYLFFNTKKDPVFDKTLKVSRGVRFNNLKVLRTLNYLALFCSSVSCNNKLDNRK